MIWSFLVPKINEIIATNTKDRQIYQEKVINRCKVYFIIQTFKNEDQLN